MWWKKKSKWKINIWLKNTEKKHRIRAIPFFSTFFFYHLLLVHAGLARAFQSICTYRCQFHVLSVCLLIYRVRNLIKQLFNWGKEREKESVCIISMSESNWTVSFHNHSTKSFYVRLLRRKKKLHTIDSLRQIFLWNAPNSILPFSPNFISVKRFRLEKKSVPIAIRLWRLFFIKLVCIHTNTHSNESWVSSPSSSQWYSFVIM